MKRFLPVLMLVFAGAIGVEWLLQRQAESHLRDEVASLQGEQGKLTQLRGEHERLIASQVPEAELSSLRTDRAATVRLRNEIESLRDGLQARERALVVGDGDRSKKETAPTPLPITLDLEGKVSMQGHEIDFAELKQRLESLPAGNQFELQLRVPKGRNDGESEAIKRSIRQVVETAKAVVKEPGIKTAQLLIRTTLE